MILSKQSFIVVYMLFGTIYNVYYTCAILLDTKITPLLLATWPYEVPVKAGASKSVTVWEWVKLVFLSFDGIPRFSLKGWEVLTLQNGTAVDAIERTGTTCEQTQCRHSVGPGANPDESGETTLDAMIMDGDNHNVGAVGGLRRIPNAISVARYVLDHTEHSLLVGESATEFAVKMGFKEESLTSNYSLKQWNDWMANQCQPNFWVNVSPDSTKSCGLYQPIRTNDTSTGFVRDAVIGLNNHDTIGIVAIDGRGSVASGTSTNGLRYKIHGRVGDSPIPGAGSYADSEIGAAACTGNGDIMMRFLPSYQTVQLMGAGLSPLAAATQAINSIKKKYPDFPGAIIAANKYGEYAAACNKWNNFAITVVNSQIPDLLVQNITCM